MKIEKRKYWLIPMFVLGISALTALVMVLWNALIPDIFGLKSINFVQAAGLLLLSKILLSPFGGHGHAHRHGFGGFKHHNRMHERWMKMSDTERTEFINQRMNHVHQHPFGHGADRFRGRCDANANDKKQADEQ